MKIWHKVTWHKRKLCICKKVLVAPPVSEKGANFGVFRIYGCKMFILHQILMRFVLFYYLYNYAPVVCQQISHHIYRSRDKGAHKGQISIFIQPKKNFRSYYGMTLSSVSASVDTRTLVLEDGLLRNFNTWFLATRERLAVKMKITPPPVFELGAKKGQFWVFSHMSL